MKTLISSTSVYEVIDIHINKYECDNKELNKKYDVTTIKITTSNGEFIEITTFGDNKTNIKIEREQNEKER